MLSTRNGFYFFVVLCFFDTTLLCFAFLRGLLSSSVWFHIVQIAKIDSLQEYSTIFFFLFT